VVQITQSCQTLLHPATTSPGQNARFSAKWQLQQELAQYGCCRIITFDTLNVVTGLQQ
jgi:hypothetical protein